MTERNVKRRLKRSSMTSEPYIVLVALHGDSVSLLISINRQNARYTDQLLEVFDMSVDAIATHAPVYR